MRLIGHVILGLMTSALQYNKHLVHNKIRQLQLRDISLKFNCNSTYMIKKNVSIPAFSFGTKIADRMAGKCNKNLIIIFKKCFDMTLLAPNSPSFLANNI